MSRWAAARMGRQALLARHFSAQPAAAAAAAAVTPASSSGIQLVTADGPSGLLACTAVGGPSSTPSASSLGSAAGNDGLAARYAELVAVGTLRPDPQQAVCIQRLDRLSRELAEYTAAVEEHRQRHAEYERRRAALRRQLLPAAEARLLAEEEAEAAAASSRLAGLQNWIGTALGVPVAAPPQRRSAAQRRAVAKARVERQLDERLGAAPPPPPAPRGVYLHGSVGSGKSLLMDLLFASAAQHGAAPHRRRLHFNAAMLELHSRMHAIERHHEAHETAQMNAYAAAVEERRRRGAPGPAAAAEAHGGGSAGGAKEGQGGSGGSAWQQVLRLDPIAQKLQRSKLARMAFRRMMRDKLSRSAAEQSASLAAANAPILRHAARALIRNCDTLQLMGVGPAGAEPSSSGSGSAAGAPGGAPPEAAAPAEEAPEPVHPARAEGEDAGAAGQGPRAASAGSGGRGGGDGSARIAALLCFDEMQVSDTFTAVALKGLLEALVAEGCVVVATSNRAPHELDSHGLNELMFSHFQASLLSACDVLPLNAREDYRRLMAASAPPLLPLGADPAHGASSPPLEPPHPQASYFFPLGPAAEAALEAQWRRLALGGNIGGAAAAPAAAPVDLPVMFGRSLRVERAAGGAAWFHFEELCGRPLGPADYLAVAAAFHTVFLEGVPALSMQARDQARRFITLIDELYNHRARLVCSAAAAPDQLFAGTEGEEPIIDLEALQFEGAVEGSRLRRNLMADGGVAPVAATAAEAAAAAQRLGGVEERFAFARAVSRLYEMQSPLYLESRAWS